MTEDHSQRWLERLRGPEPERGVAIEELRQLLLIGLSRSLGSRYGGVVQPEDIVQDALLKILGSLDGFEGRSRFLTWAMTIATRVGISATRRKYYRDISFDAMLRDELTFEVRDDPGTNVERAEEQEKLLGYLQEIIEEQLTEKQRIAIRCVLEELPVEIIADRMGSNRNAVYKLVHDARLKLREGLEHAGFSADVFRSAFA